MLSLTSFLAFFNSSSFVAHRCFGDFNSRLGKQLGVCVGMFKCFYSDFGFSSPLLNSQVVLLRLWLSLHGSGFA